MEEIKTVLQPAFSAAGGKQQRQQQQQQQSKKGKQQGPSKKQAPGPDLRVTDRTAEALIAGAVGHLTQLAREAMEAVVHQGASG